MDIQTAGEKGCEVETLKLADSRRSEGFTLHDEVLWLQAAIGRDIALHPADLIISTLGGDEAGCRRTRASNLSR